jgi:RES domain-containing protein
MNVFRLIRKKYSNSLDGKGAAKYGNRWNSKGTEIIYTADNRALAMAEIAVHLTFATLPKDFLMMEIDIPEELKIKKLELKELNECWKKHPPDKSTQKIGDDFIDCADETILKVPSAIVQGDFNYLINPRHLDFEQIKITDSRGFPFDQRLFK